MIGIASYCFQTDIAKKLFTVIFLVKRYANHATSRKKLTQKEQFYSNPLKNTSFFTQPMTHFISKKHKTTFEISVVLTMLEPRTQESGRGDLELTGIVKIKLKL